VPSRLEDGMFWQQYFMCNTLDYKGATVKENLQLLSPTSQNSAPKCRRKVCNDIAIAIIIIQPAISTYSVCI